MAEKRKEEPTPQETEENSTVSPSSIMPSSGPSFLDGIMERNQKLWTANKTYSKILIFLIFIEWIGIMFLPETTLFLNLYPSYTIELKDLLFNLVFIELYIFECCNSNLLKGKPRAFDYMIRILLALTIYEFYIHISGYCLTISGICINSMKILYVLVPCEYLFYFSGIGELKETNAKKEE